MDRLYNRVRFAYLAAAVGYVAVAALSFPSRAWFMFPVAWLLLGFTIGHGRSRLRKIRRGDF